MRGRNSDAYLHRARLTAAAPLLDGRADAKGHRAGLAERETELASVAAALRSAAEGRGSVVVVQGPLGVGKSALLGAVGELGAPSDILTLRAQAAAAEHDFSFGVVRQLIEPALGFPRSTRTAHGFEGDAADAGLVLSAEALGDQASTWPEEKRKRALSGLVALVGDMSRDRTTLLLVDDLHWADVESLQMLCRLAHAVPNRRILLVCTLLTGDVRAEQPLVRELLSLAEHTLGPANLRLDSTRSVVEERYGTSADEEFVRACHERSGGNPLFLRSILTEAQHHGLEPVTAHAADASVLRPSLLQRRLLVFLKSLPDPVRRSAFAMTVLDGNTDPYLLIRLTGLDPVRQADSLRALKDLGLIADPRRPVFTHPVVRDAVEECMELEERTALRVIAAKLLHQSGHPIEQAAEQLMAVATPQDRRATRILRAAAVIAMRRGAPRDAAGYLRRALLNSTSVGPERGRLLIDLAAAERSFATAASMGHLLEAVPLLDSVQERAAAVTDLIAPVLMNPASFQVEELLHRVAADLAQVGSSSATDHELALRLEARQRFLRRHDPVGVKEAVQRLDSLGSRPLMRTRGGRELLAVLLDASAAAHAASAAELAPLATQLLHFEQPSQAHVHTPFPLAVHVLTAAEQTEVAEWWLNAAYQVAVNRGDNVELAVIRAEQALVSLTLGDVADAKTKVRQAKALAGGGLHGLPIACVTLVAFVALKTSEPKLAERILRKSRLDMEHPCLAAQSAVAQGSIAARMGMAERSLDHFLRAGHLLAQMGWRNPAFLPWARYAALMHHRLGDTASAAELIRNEVDSARSWGAPVTLAQTLAAQGRVTAGRAGIEHLEESLEILEKSGNRYELCKVLNLLGQRLGPKDTKGRAALVRALKLSKEYDIPWLTEKIHSRLGAKPSMAGADSAPLTPSERKVARLAASGLSNQEIADDLAISRRMIERHLTSSYRKLSIEGRSDLAAALGMDGADSDA
ncbi:LuxR family transcriptional regulator [Streptomyces montanus]|uniref:LuxR family transcriptional regulator n=1 Tax=Streptomyces montanus TaxID=2580423 RepID=A0A5R9FUP8_9ACTN|nr:LuxR family transcriptional regulator [Streptomyces montanus]TLS47677.1 LuxR family transcriptional regulator [Streptomyces montanus]